MKKNIVTFEMKDEEKKVFDFAFSLSGFRNKSEFIRYMIFQSIKEFYGDIKND